MPKGCPSGVHSRYIKPALLLFTFPRSTIRAHIEEVSRENPQEFLEAGPETEYQLSLFLGPAGKSSILLGTTLPNGILERLNAIKEEEPGGGVLTLVRKTQRGLMGF
jgi:hypothetical protein